MVVSPTRQRPKKALPEHREIQTDPWMPFPPRHGWDLGAGKGGQTGETTWGKGGRCRDTYGENVENQWQTWVDDGWMKNMWKHLENCGGGWLETWKRVGKGREDRRKFQDFEML